MPRVSLNRLIMSMLPVRHTLTSVVLSGTICLSPSKLLLLLLAESTTVWTCSTSDNCGALGCSTSKPYSGSTTRLASVTLSDSNLLVGEETAVEESQWSVLQWPAACLCLASSSLSSDSNNRGFCWIRLRNTFVTLFRYAERVPQHDPPQLAPVVELLFSLLLALLLPPMLLLLLSCIKNLFIPRTWIHPTWVCDCVLEDPDWRRAGDNSDRSIGSVPRSIWEGQHKKWIHHALTPTVPKIRNFDLI